MGISDIFWINKTHWVTEAASEELPRLVSLGVDSSWEAGKPGVLADTLPPCPTNSFGLQKLLSGKANKSTEARLA